MISETLDLWSNGAVTLPKEWRKRWPTKHYIAEENELGYLVIKPILDTEYYEDEDGFGLKFRSGIEAKELADKMWKAERKIRPKK